MPAEPEAYRVLPGSTFGGSGESSATARVAALRVVTEAGIRVPGGGAVPGSGWLSVSLFPRFTKPPRY
ncbi:hypothetical protein L828_0525 [Mycobacteroides abscessus MAB_030201_1061]|nr:hypothetical protein L828_0525 [Mycobacteroides abscessus MAB_030201_1061]